MYVWIVNQILFQQQTKNKKNGFSRLVTKTKKKKQKKNFEKSVSEEGTVQSLDKNPLTSKVKVRFQPRSWSDGSVVTKAQLVAGSWSVDSGDEIRGT